MTIRTNVLVFLEVAQAALVMLDSDDGGCCGVLSLWTHRSICSTGCVQACAKTVCDMKSYFVLFELAGITKQLQWTRCSVQSISDYKMVLKRSRKPVNMRSTPSSCEHIFNALNAIFQTLCICLSFGMDVQENTLFDSV